MPSLDPPTFEFVVPLDAEVKLGDYKQIHLPYELKEITDQDIENVLDDLRSRQAILEPSDKPAKEGDQVFIRLEGRKLDIPEGQNDELIKERPMPVVIESGDSNGSPEWPFPGFSRELIGRKSGDNFDLTHTYSEDSEFESLRGIKAEFKIKVEDIKSRIVPDLNDEFAQSVGEYENLDALTKAVRENLEEQSLSDYNSDYHQQIIEKIIADSSIKYPPQMLENEISTYIEQLENRLSQQGLDLEIYLKSRQITSDALKEEIRPQAEDRLKRSLVLFEVSREEDIQINEADVEAQTQVSLQELSRSLTPDQAKKTLTPDFMRGWIGNITADLIVQKTLERLRNIAQGKVVETKVKAEINEFDQKPEQTDEQPAKETDQPNEDNNPESDVSSS
jgi:trigger factor